MSDKITILCPHCQKRYSVPANVGDKRVTCKACQNVFRTSEAIRPADREEEVIVAMVEDPQPQPSQPPLSLDGMFISSPIGQPAANPNPSFSPGVPVAPVGVPRVPVGPISQHQSNPRMVLAIVGSILTSLVLIPLCFVLNIALVISMAPRPERAKPQPKPKPNVGVNAKVDAPVIENAHSVQPPRPDIHPPANPRAKNGSRPPLSPRTPLTQEQLASAKIARLSPEEHGGKAAQGAIFQVRLGSVSWPEDAVLHDDRLFIGSALLVGGYDNDRQGVIELFEIDPAGQVSPTSTSFKQLKQKKIAQLLFHGDWSRFSWLDGKQIAHGTQTKKYSNASSFSPSGSKVASLVKKTILLHDPDQNKQISEVQTNGSMDVLAFLNEDSILTANSDSLVQWDLESGRSTKTFALDVIRPKQIVVSKDGTKICLVVVSDAFVIDLEQ